MANNPYMTPEKIRLFLLDRTPSDNFLLDDVDFANESIALACELTLARFQETEPFVQQQFTIETFPHPYTFLLGVCSILLKSKAVNMKRNSLNYQSASGTAVDDKKTADDYLMLAADFSKEFDDKARKLKTNENINEGYGFQGSQYAWNTPLF